MNLKYFSKWQQHPAISRVSDRLKRYSRIYAYAMLFLCIAYLLSLLRPELVLYDDIPAGGDTPVHFYLAKRCSEDLFPNGRITGWEPGNYCGQSIFSGYFPMPFIIIYLLQLFMPLTIAFRLATVLGVVLLPAASYYLMRSLRFSRCISVLSAAFSVMFLVSENQSMWGGNIPSMLAGEFAYSLGLCMSLVVIGTVYRGMQSGGLLPLNILLAAILGMTHGAPFIWALLCCSCYLLLGVSFWQRLRYVIYVFGGAGLLMTFWLLPLLLRGEYTTQYNAAWPVSLSEYLPVVLYPVGAWSVAATLVAIFGNRGVSAQRFDWRIGLLCSWVVAALIAFKSSFFLNVANIRFLPFGQLAVAFWAAALFDRYHARQRLSWLLALAVGMGGILYADSNIKYIPEWVYWNYSGLKQKQLYPAVQEVCKHLKGSFTDPRVAYEHSAMHEGSGTMRIFELLPLFAGRATLEGLYLQSSQTSPFIFNAQARYSKLGSAPIPSFRCDSFDLKMAARNLRMFNVSHFIAVEPKTILALNKSPFFKHEFSASPYSVYSVVGVNGAYVEHSQYKPFIYRSNNWIVDSYSWFRNAPENDIPLVLATPQQEISYPGFSVINDIKGHSDAELLPGTPALQVNIKNEEIMVNGAEPGRPLIFKISRFPKWHIEGASQMFWVSPAFMAVVPTESTVRLWYGPAALDYFALTVTLLACAGWIFLTVRMILPRKTPQTAAPLVGVGIISGGPRG